MLTLEISDGLSSKSLPVTVRSGRATFKADLRLRVQCGAEAEFFGIGAGAELGIYANIIEFVAVLDSTPTCELQSTEWWDLNVGAFAHFDVVVDYTTMGAIPTISTTLLTAPTLTQCWISRSPAETEGQLTQTASTISIPAKSDVVSVAASSPPEDGPSETFSYITIPTITTAPSLSVPVSPSSSVRYPVANSSAPTGGDDMVTSTIYATSVYTITSCAAGVVNCPASYQKEILVTQTVDVYTTVCPVSANITLPTTTSTNAVAVPTAAAIVHVITDVVVLVPCPTPLIETFAPPSTLVAPIVHQVTAAAVAATTPSSSTDAAPSLVVAGNAAKAAQWNNGTVTYTLSASGTGVPSTSVVQTTAAPATTAVTAGAPARAVTGGLVVAVVAVGTLATWILL